MIRAKRIHGASTNVLALIKFLHPVNVVSKMFSWLHQHWIGFGYTLDHMYSSLLYDYVYYSVV